MSRLSNAVNLGRFYEVCVKTGFSYLEIARKGDCLISSEG